MGIKKLYMNKNLEQCLTYAKSSRNLVINIGGAISIGGASLMSTVNSPVPVSPPH